MLKLTSTLSSLRTTDILEGTGIGEMFFGNWSYKEDSWQPQLDSLLYINV
jgi:hypothetical protein